MRWIKIGVVLILIEIVTGCRAKQEVTENAVIGVEMGIEARHELEREVSVVATIEENVVLESPVIEIQDKEGSGTVVIRGEKLIRGRQGVKGVASENKNVEYRNIEEDTEIVENQEMRAEVKVGIDKTYLTVAILIFILLIVIIKKKN